MAIMRIAGQDIQDADIYQTIFRHFPDIIHSVDSDGKIVFTNRKAESLLGYTHEELIGKNVREIYADEILQKMEEGFKQLKADGEKTAVESLLKDRAGNNIPVEIRSFSIYDDAGNFIRTFSIIRDIRDVKQLQESLVHAGRLAAIGELASGIAHDINNPLTVLLLANELALLGLKQHKGPRPPVLDQLERSLRDIEKASEVIRKLADHLRNFSRGMVEQHEVVDIHGILADSLFIAQNKVAKSQTKVVNNVEKGRHYVSGAPNQLEQVFVNLIANACDAMMETKNSQLSIDCAETNREGTACWRFDVTDNGHGIPEDVREHVFQSFFTTKEKGKGTGLGLSISRGIIKNHEGDIEVASEVGKGTTFSVFLPCHKPTIVSRL
ncbi:MAG: PAS domain S-box protein [Kiritimatiellae bacterium]|nr:PAS domain S-box protein [Kiritimatiellia bacterium]